MTLASSCGAASPRPPLLAHPLRCEVVNHLDHAAVFKCVVALRMKGAIMDENQKGELVTSPTCQRTHIVQAQASNSRRAVVDALAGSVSGVCGVIVGQPFDTIRVRQQTKSFSSSASSSMISLFRKSPPPLRQLTQQP